MITPNAEISHVLESLGLEPAETGGGCTAYRADADPGEDYWLLTWAEDSRMPLSWAEEVAWGRYRDHEDEGIVTYFPTLIACVEAMRETLRRDSITAKAIAPEFPR